MQTPTTPWIGADLDALLSVRLNRTLTGSVLASRTATIVFDAGTTGVWTVELLAGRGSVQRGARPRPTLVIRAAAEVLVAVVSGRISGVEAFLAGRLSVRGDLALSLQLDGLWDRDTLRPVEHPQSFEVRALGVRTLYLEAGPPDAPPVLLLHGLGATNASLLPVLADLARDFRVLAPDLPGFGSSDAPGVSYTSAWFAAWVDDFLRAVDARPAVVLGNSLGGRIALEVGLTRPGSVRGLVLLTPSPAFRRLRQLTPVVRLLSPQWGRLPVRLANHRLTVESIRLMFAEPDRLPHQWYDAAADEAVRVLESAPHRVAFLSCSRQIYLESAYGREGFWDRLPMLQPPALFLWGDRDRLVPSTFARHVTGALPHATSVVLPDCGHVPQFEQPTVTMALVREFLADLPA